MALFNWSGCLRSAFRTVTPWRMATKHGRCFRKVEYESRKRSQLELVIAHHSYDRDLSCFNVPECSFNIKPYYTVKSNQFHHQYLQAFSRASNIRWYSASLTPGSRSWMRHFELKILECWNWRWWIQIWIPFCELPSSVPKAFLKAFFVDFPPPPKKSTRFLVFHHSCDHGCRPPQVAQQENLVVMVCHCNFSLEHPTKRIGKVHHSPSTFKP